MTILSLPLPVGFVQDAIVADLLAAVAAAGVVAVGQQVE